MPTAGGFKAYLVDNKCGTTIENSTDQYRVLIKLVLTKSPPRYSIQQYVISNVKFINIMYTLLKFKKVIFTISSLIMAKELNRLNSYLINSL